MCIENELSLRPFHLQDRERVLRTLRDHRHQIETSEPSFPNIWVWGHYPGFTYVDDHLLTQYVRNEGEPNRFLPPIGPDPEGMMRSLLAQGIIFDRVGPTLASRFCHDPTVRVTELMDDADYCYSPEELRRCGEGEKPQFAKLRGHLHRIGKRNLDVRRITPDELPACRVVNQRWLDSKGAGITDDHRDDAAAAAMMLDHFAELEMFGVVLYIDGQPEGFMLGEVNSSGVGVLHFVKTNLKIRGLSDFGFHKWATSVPEGCNIVNFMQDCGADGLRRYKTSLGPSHKVMKYRIEPL